MKMAGNSAWYTTTKQNTKNTQTFLPDQVYQTRQKHGHAMLPIMSWSIHSPSEKTQYERVQRGLREIKYQGAYHGMWPRKTN